MQVRTYDTGFTKQSTRVSACDWRLHNCVRRFIFVASVFLAPSLLLCRSPHFCQTHHFCSTGLPTSVSPITSVLPVSPLLSVPSVLFCRSPQFCQSHQFSSVGLLTSFSPITSFRSKNMCCWSLQNSNHCSKWKTRIGGKFFSERERRKCTWSKSLLSCM